jgi:tetratricopeptide (TPR) repeat protein
MCAFLSRITGSGVSFFLLLGMKKILLPFLCICTFTAFPQNMDSLKQLLQTQLNDTTRLGIYKTIVVKTDDINLKAEYAGLEYKLAKKKLDENPSEDLKKLYFGHLAYALNAQGEVNWANDKLMECFYNLKEAEKLCLKAGDELLLAFLINNLAVVCDYFGDSQHSVECYTKNISVLEKYKDTASLADSYYNFGLLYADMGNLSKTEECYGRALKCYRATGKTDMVAELENGLAGVYYKQGNIQRSLDYYAMALKTGQGINDKKSIAISKNKLAKICQDQKKFAQAAVYYNESLRLLEELNDQPGQATLLRNVATLYMDQNNFKMAELSAVKALGLAREIKSFANIRDEAEILCKIYNSQSKTSEAPAMCALFAAMNDSIKNQEARKTARFLAFKEKYEKYDAQERENAQQENAVVKKEEGSGNRITYLAIAGVLVAAGAGWLIYRRKK